MPLASQAAALENALEQDTIRPDQYLDIQDALETATARGDVHFPIDPLLLGEGPSVGRGSDLNDDRDAPAGDLLSLTEKPIEAVNAEEDPDLPHDFAPLIQVAKSLFGSEGADIVQVFDICVQLPTDNTLIHGYRPGHAPVDGVCPFCGTCPKQPSKTSRKPSNTVKFMSAHVNACGAEKAMRLAMSGLLAQYSLTFPVNPIDKYSVAGKELNVFRASRTLDKLKQCTCLTCEDAHEMGSRDAVTEHLVVKHGIHIPQIFNGYSTAAGKVLNAAVKRLEWTAERLDFRHLSTTSTGVGTSLILWIGSLLRPSSSIHAYTNRRKLLNATVSGPTSSYPTAAFLQITIPVQARTGNMR